MGYPVDGLICVSEKNAYFCGKDPSLLKYKTIDHHTIDFLLRLRKSPVTSRTQGIPNIGLVDLDILQLLDTQSVETAVVFMLLQSDSEPVTVQEKQVLFKQDIQPFFPTLGVSLIEEFGQLDC